MDDLTPVELRNGLWYKREDLYTGPFGVNGSKLRACQHLIEGAFLDGFDHVISASSVRSPQAAMSSVVAAGLHMACTVIIAATTPELAVRNHRSVAIAQEAGATIHSLGRGPAYNSRLQNAGAKMALETPGGWQLPYGITTPKYASPEAVESFLEVGGAQVANLPDEIETLVLPFGSANTATGVLWGLQRVKAPASLKRIVLVEIGPSRVDWSMNRLDSVGVHEMAHPGVSLEFITLHNIWAEYADLMPETLDDIVLHPTYEGKVVRFLNVAQPDWWTARDGKTCFWIVGGPI